jgi:hypothetical protein
MVQLKTVRKKGKYPPHIASPTTLKIGFPRGRSEQSNILKAIWNEFGTRRIPARPFLRTTMRNQRKKYLAMAHKDAKQIFAGTMTAHQSLSRIGIVAQGDVQMSIVKGGWEPNAPSTIRRKGSSRPLIDTGAMRQAVTWVVENA